MQATTSCHLTKDDINVRRVYSGGDSTPVVGFGQKHDEAVTLYFRSWDDALHLANLIQELHASPIRLGLPT